MSDYELTSSEFDGVQAFLSLQHLVATGVTDNFDFIRRLDAITAAWPATTNPRVRGWIDELFKGIAGISTNHQVPVSGLYLLLRFRAFLDWFRANHPNSGFVPVWFAEFQNGRGETYQPYQPPAAPPSWRAAVSAVNDKWKKDPPALVSRNAEYVDNALHRQEPLLRNWNNQADMRGGTAGAWQLQKKDVAALIARPAMTADEYVFLLHALLVLGAGPADCADLARGTVSTIASSPEYPNDTFISQLVYLALLHLADPKGPNVFTNVRLQQWLATLQTLARGTDPASTAVRLSLQEHLKVAQADVAYPMHDPYNPAVGFHQRLANALHALDEARAAMTSRVA